MAKESSRIKPFLVDMHPQKTRIIELLLEKKTVRYIASVISPPISAMAIQRYRAKVFKPTMARADVSAKILGMDRAIEERKVRTEAKTQAKRGGKQVKPIPDVSPEAARATVLAIRDQEILTIREGRVQAAQKRHRKFSEIVARRGEQMAGEAPGAETGFLTRDYKNLGAEIKSVYKFDAPLASAFLETEKQIAIELGQWQENVPGNMSIQIVCPSTSGDPAQQPRISYASADQIEDDVVDLGLIQIPG